MPLNDRIAANKKAEHERGEHRLALDKWCKECASQNDRLRSLEGVRFSAAAFNHDDMAMTIAEPSTMMPMSDRREPPSRISGRKRIR